MSGPSETAFRDDPDLGRSLGRWQGTGAVLLLALVLAFPVYLGVDSTRRGAAEAARQRALVDAGGQLWGLNCASCHGLQGQGVDAPALNSRQFLSFVSDIQIHRITAVGIPGSEMPAWWNELGGPLTDEQIAAIVAYLRSWEPTAPDRPDWRTPREEGG